MRITVLAAAFVVAMTMPVFLLADMTGAIQLSHATRILLVVGCAIASGVAAIYFYPLMLYGDKLQSDETRVAAVEASGRPTFETVTAGYISGMRFQWPFLRIEIRSGGLVIRPVLFLPFAILRAEIVLIQMGRYPIARVLEIHHTSTEVESPILLTPVSALSDHLKRAFDDRAE
jgi:hypothetical protein